MVYGGLTGETVSLPMDSALFEGLLKKLIVESKKDIDEVCHPFAHTLSLPPSLSMCVCHTLSKLNFTVITRFVSGLAKPLLASVSLSQSHTLSPFLALPLSLVGCGRVSLRTNLDTRHAKRLRSTGRPLMCSPTTNRWCQCPTPWWRSCWRRCRRSRSERPHRGGVVCESDREWPWASSTIECSLTITLNVDLLCNLVVSSAGCSPLSLSSSALEY
jgi:hypothetical protein